MKRIALFFDRTYIDAHSCFTELARHLSASGFEVDLFCYSSAYGPAPAFYDDRIRVIKFPQDKFEFAQLWYKLSFAKDYQYCAVFGTPFEGAFLAHRVSRKLRVPMIYLADEVYNADLDRHNFPDYKKLKEKDRLVNKYATASIALGEERYEYQAKINELPPDHKHFVIPNSPPGSSVQLRSHYFRDIFSITDDKPIVLFIGTLQWNLAKKLYEQSQGFTDKPYHLIFHSRSLGLMGGKPHPFIKISEKPVSSTMLNYVVSSADIGLVLYDKDNVAESENALTGGKIGTYLKNDLPLIAGNVEAFKVIEQKGMGVYLEDVSRLDAAVEQVQKNKTACKNKIVEIYARDYEYTFFYKKFESFLNGIIR